MGNKNIFEELSAALGGKEKINEKNIADILMKNRNKIRSVLEASSNKEDYQHKDGKTSWHLFFADFREYLWIPRYMSLGAFNALTEVIMISWEHLDYDDFLKIFKKSQALSKIQHQSGSYKWPDVSKLIKHQWEYMAQWLVEIVANAIDASVVDKSIWRFWEGFYQSLKFLSSENDTIVVETKKQWEKWFQISLKNTDWEHQIWSMWIEKKDLGTSVMLNKKLSPDEQVSLKNFVISRFKTNNKINIFLNWEKINNLEAYTWIKNWFENVVQIQIDNNGFRVIDSWVGMSAKDLSEKLLAPNMSWKTRLNSDSMSDEDIETNTRNETSFFYKYFEHWKQEKINNEIKNKKTSIRLQIWGVLIEELFEHTSYNLEEFGLELPSFTWLPESRNKIELTKEVVVSLKIALEKIANNRGNEEEKLMLLEVISKIIQHLKARESSSSQTKWKYDINKVAKQTFKKIKQELEQNWKIVIAAISGIQDILPKSENIVFIDPVLLKFEAANVPGIKKLENIENKQVEFYEVAFSETAKYDYLILNWVVLVNSKYTKDQKSRDLLNTQINLNTDYEQDKDRVFYGLIKENNQSHNPENTNASDVTAVADEQNSDMTEDEIKENEEIKAAFQNILIGIENDMSHHTDSDIVTTIQTIHDEFLSDNTSENISKLKEINLKLPWVKEKIFMEKFLLRKSISRNISLSQNLLIRIYNFISENSSEPVNIFMELIRKLSNKDIDTEKYIDIILSLLADNSSFMYILQYIKDFNSWEMEYLRRLDTSVIGNQYIDIVTQEIWYFLHYNHLDLLSITIWKNYGYAYCSWNKSSECIEHGDIDWFELETKEGVKVIIDWETRLFYQFDRRRMCTRWYTFWDLYNTPNQTKSGILYGLRIKDWKLKIFVWDEIIETIWNYDYNIKVPSFNSLKVTDDGIPYWNLPFDGKNKIFYWNKFVETIWWYQYEALAEPIVSDWKLVIISTINWECRLSIWDEIINTIWWYQYDSIDALTLINWDLLAWDMVVNWEKMLFIWDEVIANKIYMQEIGRKRKNFLDFLHNWWVFLSEKANKINFEPENHLLLTDLIWISRFFENWLEELRQHQEAMSSKEWDRENFLHYFYNFIVVYLLSLFWKNETNTNSQKTIIRLPEKNPNDHLATIYNLTSETEKKLQNRAPYQRQITSTIDGQDRTSMIWLREAVQNCRDAILKARKNWSIHEEYAGVWIDFYQHNDQWIARISDWVWMSFYEVFKYLLTPWVSGKTGEDGATGMFWQWFYSLLIWAKEVQVKTSSWDGQTTYIKLSPIYNQNKDIVDFEISYDLKEEDFTGTIIERYDENGWVWWNIWALIWIQNLEKYVWNIDDIFIRYNWDMLNAGKSIKILEQEKVHWLWYITLKQNPDKQERLTKDNLFLSEIKEGYIDFFPDFMRDYIRNNGYSLDLPAKIGLTKTRNAITDFEENIAILKPYIFNIFTKHIISEYLAGKTRLPMMPLDYYGLDLYEWKFNEVIVNMAKKTNAWGTLASEEIAMLTDKGAMIQYLINLKIYHNWETISIRQLKRKRDDEEFVKKHTDNSYAIHNNSRDLNTQSKIVKTESEEHAKFLEHVNTAFTNVFMRILWTNPELWFAKTEALAFADGKWIYFNVNKLDYFHRLQSYELIWLITHELTHLVEVYVKWYGIDFEEVINSWKNLKALANWKTYVSDNSFWSHQKDLEHSHSFEKIQRDILALIMREKLY
jgi:hypothetical protein